MFLTSHSLNSNKLFIKISYVVLRFFFFLVYTGYVNNIYKYVIQKKERKKIYEKSRERKTKR